MSNAELLAILLGSGSANESAVALSKRILASVGNSLTALGKQTLAQLTAFKGIGEAKAITIPYVPAYVHYVQVMKEENGVPKHLPNILWNGFLSFA